LFRDFLRKNKGANFIKKSKTIRLKFYLIKWCFLLAAQREFALQKTSSQLTNRAMARVEPLAGQAKSCAIVAETEAK
jgi:hypothetical protein